MYNADGSLRSRREIESALRSDGLGIDFSRFTQQLLAVRGKRRRPPANDDEVRAHLRRGDGSLRTQREVIDALQASGLGLGEHRVATFFREATDE